MVPTASFLRVAGSTVFPDHPSSTDENNPLGSVLKPRKTLPNPIPAGTIVDLIGTYAQNQTSPRTLKVLGTEAQPVTIRAGYCHTPGLVTADWEVTGSYFSIEGLHSKNVITILAPSSFATAQQCEFSGSPTQRAGVIVASYSDAFNKQIAIYRNHIHDSGDVNATFDQDFHAIGIGARSEYIFIEGNTLERCSGDGVQINGGQGGHGSCHHIFASHNICKDNNQTGLWAKQSQDVVFYRNVVSGARPGPSTSGVGIGGQYDPEHLWIVENDIFNCYQGVRIASDTDDGIIGTHRFILGNKFHDIRNPVPAANPSDPYRDAAISIWSLGQTRVFENVITDCDCAIASAHASAKVYDAGNVLTNVGKARVGTLTPVEPIANIKFIRDYYTKRYLGAA